ncbi:hypothetical protein HPO96_17040 [Kribbella sandramycini]|uniref:HAMP domain-containing protein n=1 Tax=Kribbella sandramycini TaxID=60450 RepID=A0A7Y4L0C6_9ACTN|nr:hypothetical protein [Kribbella sandramycini]MBB6565692.1 HAMP domain-containing protein [Kribbella sandramycini]NOL41954.1 hypothetical protein [Kribbella sandramycini]
MDLECHVSEGVQAVANGWLENARRMAADFFTSALNSQATFWVKTETPVQLATTADQQSWTNSVPVAFVHEKTLILTGAIFTLAIIIAGVRMAWEQRARPLQELLKAMLIFVLVSAAGTAVIQLLVEWSDAFALDVVQSATGGATFTDRLQTMMGAQDYGGLADLKSGLMMILLFQVAGIASLIQIVLLLVRSAMLVLLGATLPLAAAATNTEMGKAWFRKYCAWTLAFIAYKPAAALIYAAAIKLKEQEMLGPGGGLTGAMTALMMMALAIFALPALLRFAVPITAAASGGGAGMGSSVADPGGLATGAINVGRARSGSALGGASGGGLGGSAGGSALGGGASGARSVGAAAGLGAAAGAVTAARKASGALSGAAAHSAGESGGGSGTPSSFPRGSGGGGGGGRSGGGSRGGGGGRNLPPGRGGVSGGGASGGGWGGEASGGGWGGGPSGASGGSPSYAGSVPEPAGPSGNW